MGTDSGEHLDVFNLNFVVTALYGNSNRCFDLKKKYMYLFLMQNNGRVGDEFMRQIEPIAAYVPYMTCPGNHEKA